MTITVLQTLQHGKAKVLTYLALIRIITESFTMASMLRRQGSCVAFIL